MSDYHTPVLTREVIEALHVIKGKIYIDATLGGAGHTKEILKAGGIVLGIDTDAQAIAHGKERLKECTGYTLVQGNFKDLEEIAKKNGFLHIDGILFDLGVSSHQLDTPERGFSYRFTDAPLDLRLSQSGGDTAAQLVNRMTEGELYECIGKFGEEQLALAIARALCSTRSIKKIETVNDIVEVIEKLAGSRERATPILSRVFQALRIVVNDELKSLKSALGQSREILKPAGRLVVISFHSLEDRIVKQYMRGNGWKVLTKHPIIPSEREVYENKRSRSAKLRVAEKI
ncbi:MAG: 16S rRNA (cytosine(1402)-N(4))-methyltransferase RsmH [Patescibacteria group bacterium]